ncbi:kinase suppressor of Ras 2 [Cylas formicarius]|uniref:kinase suppressor of Ras 2 n=1 Tax=Cylas formicarius TaxID=197179 RepID=UPI00295876FC|nr:kinase suppressor of Ras 2 [Cylas formicarius]
MANDSSEEDLRKNLDILQSMIDVSAERLEGLRTQCATSAELTRQEIRTLEGKLIKLFSQQLVTKLKLRNGIEVPVPSVKQWLQVVGLGKDSIVSLSLKISSVEELQEKSEHELKSLLAASAEEASRLCRALHSLKKYTDVLKRGESQDGTQDSNLSWDSWDRHHYLKIKSELSPRAARSRATRASVPSEENLFNNNNKPAATITSSPSVSSINSLNAGGVVLGPPLTPPAAASATFSPQTLRGKEKKFPTTPPARRKHLTNNAPALLPDSFPLTKSKSHESQLAASKAESNTELNNISETKMVVKRARLPTEPGPETMGLTSPVLTSPVKSPPYNSTGTDSDDSSYTSISLQVPKKMTHQINHRFTKTFKLMTSCGLCLRPILGMGLKCKECKYTCHRECEEKVAPSCGLPPEYLDEFKKTVEGQVFPSPTASRSSKTNNIMNSLTRGRHRKNSHPQPPVNVPPPDSSSNTSSCNSSTPSSPAIQTMTTLSSQKQSQFHFPDATTTHADPAKKTTTESHPTQASVNSPRRELVSSQQSKDSDRTASQTSNSNSTDSDRTPVRLDSQDSQVSDTETISDGHRWPRQNSLSMREWDIPYDELKVSKPVGTGRFGTVYRGYWHGDVAVKLLNVSYLKDEKTLEQFKMEVSIFRKTRHENLILFMGACMKPPKLAIVTSFSKGNTLYTHIHLRKDKFNMDRTTMIAQQICQGMGYLHAKGIVHKDLKSKNIFLENGKVVIADFGLFSVTKLCFGHRKSESLSIPPGWLCYLAPEIMRCLDAHIFEENELPFSKASDVYAFGTVWYELLCGEWPFKDQPPESVIWQVGKGMKQPLANLQASGEVKDILMLCWQYREENRPDFIRILDFLKKLPKKKLARSPSHPIHLSRSAESVFM